MTDDDWWPQARDERSFSYFTRLILILIINIVVTFEMIFSTTPVQTLISPMLNIFLFFYVLRSSLLLDMASRP